MIISRTLARKRLKAGERPSMKAAWIPVALDIGLIGLVLAIAFQPAVLFVYAMKFSLVWLAVFFFFVFYVPAQIVIITSTIWAVRSRWEEKA